MNEQASQAALDALALHGQALIPKFDAAIRARDTAATDALVEELTAILQKMAALRIELGDAAELLEFVQQFSARAAVNLSLPGGLQ